MVALTSGPGPSADRLNLYAERLHVAVISDSLDAVSGGDHVMAPRLRPVAPSQRPIVGRAATARAVGSNRIPERPYEKLLEAIDDLEAGDVLVLAADGQLEAGMFGGLLATAAKERGAVGCVADGAVRDSSELVTILPTMAAGFSAADSLGRQEFVDHDQTVRCGGVEVSPGDIVAFDEDGVVVVPAALEDEVFERALAKVDREGNMRGDLEHGMPVSEAFSRYRIL